MSKSLTRSLMKVQTEEARAWMRAAETGDVLSLKSLLDAGVPVNFASENGETALMRAAAKGHADVLEFLLDEGASVNAQRDDGFNALIVAVFFGHEDVVRALLSRGADTSARTRLGTTAEKWAADRGFTEIVELLKAADAARARATNDSPPAVGLAEWVDDSDTLPLANLKKDMSVGKTGESTAELLTRRLQSVMQEQDALPPASSVMSAPPVGLTMDEKLNEIEVARAPLTPKIKSQPRPTSSGQRFRKAVASWPVTMVALPLVLISGSVVGYSFWQRTKAHTNVSPSAPQQMSQTVEQSGAAQQQQSVLPVTTPPVLNAETQPTPLPAGANGLPLSDVNVVPLPGSVIPVSDGGIGRSNASSPPAASGLPSVPTVISESSDQATGTDTSARRETQAGGQRDRALSSAAADIDGRRTAGGQQNASPSRNEKQDGSALSPAPLNAGITQSVSAPPPQPTPKKKVIQWP